MQNSFSSLVNTLNLKVPAQVDEDMVNDGEENSTNFVPSRSHRKNIVPFSPDIVAKNLS